MTYHFEWSVLIKYHELLLEGVVATLELAGIALVLSLVGGAFVGVARTFLPRSVAWLFAAYTELFRNVPPIVQFFFWYFAGALDSFSAAIVGLSMFTSAYIAEIIRSGINSIPHTQIEAARSSGLTTLQVIFFIVLPQALIRVVPPLSIEFINIIKNSAVAMTIGYTELTFQSQEIEARTFRGFEAATAATVLYAGLALGIVLLMHGIEYVVSLNIRRG